MSLERCYRKIYSHYCHYGNYAVPLSQRRGVNRIVFKFCHYRTIQVCIMPEYCIMPVHLHWSELIFLFRPWTQCYSAAT